MDWLRLLLRTALLTLCTVIALAKPKSTPIWGTYRPHALVSVRAQVPHSPVFGFVYHSLHNTDIRHLASDREDSIRSFSWRRHDGEFGDQIIQDNDLNLRINTQFVPHSNGKHWALRFSAEALHAAKPTAPISVVFYAASGAETREYAQAQGGTSFSTQRKGKHVEINGEDKSVGKFKLTLSEPTSGSVEYIGESKEQGASDASHTRLRKRSDNLQTRTSGLSRFLINNSHDRSERSWMVEDNLSQKYMQQLKHMKHEGGSPTNMPMLLGDKTVKNEPGLFVQRILKAPFSVQVKFSSVEDADTVEETKFDVDEQIEKRNEAFDRKFEQVFKLSHRNIEADEIEFAKQALSNVLGGIGYFHGRTIAENRRSQQGVELLDAVNLLTATPSRSSFPRGFLWDEGFHQIIIQRWNQDITQNCINSWLSLIQESGWIPREQILGIEAQTRFPQHIRHLLIQKPDIANPPTLFLPLRVLAKTLIDHQTSNDTNKSAGENVCNSDGTDGVCRAEVVEQSGISETEMELTKQFLKDTSKRMSVYFEWLQETQVGIEQNTFRWRGRQANQVPSKGGYPLTLASGIDDYPRGHTPHETERHVDLQAWMAWAAGALSEMTAAYGGDNSEYIKLHETYVKTLHSHYYSRDNKMLCDHTGAVSNCHEGYVTLLPFALGLLSPDDELVGSALDALESDTRLLSPAGVRSLSASDSAYRLGDDYWTGAVWMPFNFLTLAALRTKYAVVQGPYRARAESLFQNLRQRVLSNAFHVWKDTGLLWENYEPELGSGRRGRQFTGWSSLVVLIYADMYQGVVV